MKILAAALSAALLVGCAAFGRRPGGSLCDDLSGKYEMETATCEMNRGLIQLPENVVTLMPDNSAMVDGTMKVEIEQKNCEQLSLRSGDAWASYDGSRDRDGRFVVRQGAESNAEQEAKSNSPPAPIVLFSGGANSWTLERDGADLIYVRRYHERGLFMLFMPYAAHREVSCRLRRTTSG